MNDFVAVAVRNPDLRMSSHRRGLLGAESVMEGRSRGVDDTVDHQLAEVLRQQGKVGREARHAYD